MENSNYKYSGIWTKRKRLSMRHVLGALVLLCSFACLQEVSAELPIVVDSVTVGNNTLIGKKDKGFSGKFFYIYYVDKLVAKRDSVHKVKRDFGFGMTGPIYRDYPLFVRERKKNEEYVIALFEDNDKGILQNQMYISPYILIDEDGFSFCYKITSRMRLTDIFPAAKLIEKIFQIDNCKFTTPLVRMPEHGYLETEL